MYCNVVERYIVKYWPKDILGKFTFQLFKVQGRSIWSLDQIMCKGKIFYQKNIFFTLVVLLCILSYNQLLIVAFELLKVQDSLEVNCKITNFEVLCHIIPIHSYYLCKSL